MPNGTSISGTYCLMYTSSEAKSRGWRTTPAMFEVGDLNPVSKDVKLPNLTHLGGQGPALVCASNPVIIKAKTHCRRHSPILEDVPYFLLRSPPVQLRPDSRSVGKHPEAGLRFRLSLPRDLARRRAGVNRHLDRRPGLTNASIQIPTRKSWAAVCSFSCKPALEKRSVSRRVGLGHASGR